MTSGTTSPTQERFDAELASAVTASRCPSVVAAVSRNGAQLCSSAAGSVTGRAGGRCPTPATAYRIGSITKTITAITVLQQVAAGHLNLDAPIGDVLPELATDVRHISPRSLLMHGSGLLAEPSGPWWERSEGRTWTELLPQIHLNPDLIGRFHYSNTGYAVLGQLVARCTGRTWWDLARDDVLIPLKMNRTTYDAPLDAAPGLAVHPDLDLLHSEPAHDTAAMAPAGQLWSTAADVTRLGEFLACGDEAVLPGALRRRMSMPGLVADVPGRNWTRSYGHGIDVTQHAGERYIGHGGSMPGFVASLRVREADGASIALLANSTAGVCPDLAYRLLDLIDVARPGDTAKRDNDTTTDLLGRWFWGPLPYTASSRPGGGLELTPEGNGRGSRFSPCGSDRWVGHDEYFAGETLNVLKRGGTPYLDLGTFRLTRAPYDPGSDIPGGVDPAGWH